MNGQSIQAPIDSAGSTIRRPVQWWLLTGVIMVFFQVVIGGITRLTDSGLSITEWSVIQGTIPPLNQAAWEEAFELYKQAARKQFETLHAEMSLQEFKVIFFWEYIHRLWARLMGFVFLLPLAFFVWKKWIPAWLGKRLAIVFLLAASAAVFGWIMVKSGLNNDDRTWVSAYKLIIHLGIATVLFGYLFWTWLRSLPFQVRVVDKGLHRWGWVVIAVLLFQILFGGLMAGMRAGLIHPYFPFFVEGQRLLAALSASSEVALQNFVDYEPSLFVKALVQVVHRATAYLLTALVIWYFFKLRKVAAGNLLLNRSSWLLIAMISLQFLLGVLTVIHSIGRIPVTYGVLHQAGALVLLASLLLVTFQVRTRKSTTL